MYFDDNVEFSEEFREQLRLMGEKRQKIRSWAEEYAKSIGEKGEQPGTLGFDKRYFGYMIDFTEGMTEEEKKQKVFDFCEKYADPQRRKEVLDQYYDSIENMKIENWDLSMITEGGIKEPKEKGTLTKSEKDVLEAFELSNKIAMTIAEMKQGNENYFEERYPSVQEKQKFWLQSKTSTSLSTYLGGMCLKNGIELGTFENMDERIRDTMKDSVPKRRDLFERTEEHRKFAADILEGKPPVEGYHVEIHTDMKNKEKYEELWKKVENGETVKAENYREIFNDDLDDLLSSYDDKKIVETKGVSSETFYSVDGKNLLDYVKEKGGNPKKSLDAKVYLLEALTSGTHKVELSQYLMEPDGQSRLHTNSLIVSSKEIDAMHPDQPSLSEKTKALWQEDTGKEARRNSIQDDIERKIITKNLDSNKEKIEKLGDEFKKADSLFHKNSREYKDMITALGTLQEKQKEISDNLKKENRTTLTKEERQELEVCYKAAKERSEKYLSDKTPNRKTKLGKERYNAAVKLRDYSNKALEEMGVGMSGAKKEAVEREKTEEGKQNNSATRKKISNLLDDKNANTAQSKKSSVVNSSKDKEAKQMKGPEK